MQQWEEKKKESFKIFDRIAPTYDLLNRTLSLGIDKLWRRELSHFIPKKSSIQALDLATGTCDVAIELVRQNNSIDSVIGLDMSQEMLDFGQKKIEKLKLGHKIKLVREDAHNLPYEDDSFDLITLSFGVRNFSDPLCAMKEMKRVLSPGGRTLIMEFSLPENELVKKAYLLYFRNILPAIGKVVSKDPHAYSYLNETVEDFPYGEDFLDIARAAGFTLTKFHSLTFGIAQIYELGMED